jgi:hypothetical protein
MTLDFHPKSFDLPAGRLSLPRRAQHQTQRTLAAATHKAPTLPSSFGGMGAATAKLMWILLVSLG